MSEGDVRLNIGINLDEVDAKLESLEKKLTSLPDVKANIEITSAGAEQKLNKVQRDLQRKAGELIVKAKTDFTELNNLDSAVGLVRENLQALVSEAQQSKIKPGVDPQGLISLDAALAVAAEAFNVAAAEINSTVIKPKVDLTELIELNQELDRKQKHWKETRNLFRQSPISGRVEVRTSDRAGQGQTVRPQRQQAAPRVVRGVDEAVARASRRVQPVIRALPGQPAPRALPPARNSFFDTRIFSEISRDLKLLLSTTQSQAGVLMAPGKRAMEELLAQSGQRRPRSSSIQTMFRYDPPLSVIRQRQGQEDIEKMIRKSGYTEQQLDQAFNKLAEKNRILESGGAFSEIAPSLVSQSRFKFLPPSKVRATFKNNPDFKTETIADSRALDPVIEAYVKRRAERISGVRSSGTQEIAKALESTRQASSLDIGPAINREILKVLNDAFKSIPQQLMGGLARIKRTSINLNPRELQYKAGSNERGEVGSLKGVEKWDDNIAGVLSVWKDPSDGKTYVVNGHNRLGLAEKLDVDELNVRYIDAKTIEEARRIGAMENIAAGAGTAIDAAKFFRDSGIKSVDAIKRVGLPLSSGKATKGLALAGLPQDLFDAVVRGDLQMERGAVIGGSGLSEEKQRELLKFAGSSTRTPNRQLKELIDLQKHTNTVVSETPTILGMEQLVETDLRERLKILDGIKQALKSQKRLFSKVAQNADVLSEQAGNVINVDENQQIAETAEKIFRVFDSIKFTSPAISRAINTGVDSLALGERISDIMKDVIPEVTAAVEAELDSILSSKKQALVEEAGTPLLNLPPQGGLTVQDVTNSAQQAELAKQQEAAAREAGDLRGAEAWAKELRQVQRDRLAADMAAQALSQSNLFGIGEHDTSLPLLGAASASVVNAEVVSTTPFDKKPGQAFIAESMRQGLEAIWTRLTQQLATEAGNKADEIVEEQFKVRQKQISAGSAEKTYAIRLGKRQLEGIHTALQTDIDTPQTHGAALKEAGVKLSTSMKLTARQLTALVKELDQSALLDDIDSTIGDYPELANAKAAFGKMRELAFKEGLIKRQANGSVGVLGAEKVQPRQVSAIEQFAKLIGELQDDLKKAQPYKPSSRMFGGLMAEWTSEQQEQYKKAQSEYRAWDKENKLASGINTAIGYNSDFQQNFPTMALGGLAELIETRKGGLQARTTRDLASALSKATGKDVGDTRKEIAQELRGLSGESADLFVSGILTDLDQATESGMRLGRALIAGVKAVLQMRSPSKVMLELGRLAALSFINGFKEVIAGADVRRLMIAEQIVEPIRNSNSLFASRSESNANQILSSIPGLTSNPRAAQLMLQQLPDRFITTDLLGEASKQAAFYEQVPSAKETQGLIKGFDPLLKMLQSAFTDYTRTLNIPDPWIGKIGNGIQKILDDVAASQRTIGGQRLLPPASSLSRPERTEVQIPGFAPNVSPDGANYRTLIDSIADLTIDPDYYRRRIEAVGLQNMPGELLNEASARGTFQDYFPDAKIERIARQLPGTLERLIETAFVKSFDSLGTSNFVSSNLSAKQIAGSAASPQNPGIREQMSWDGLLARDNQTGKIISRAEGLRRQGQMIMQAPTVAGSASLPLFDLPRQAMGAIPDPWATPNYGTYRMQGEASIPSTPIRQQLLLPPARMPEPPVSPIFTAPATTSRAATTGSFNFGSSTNQAQANASKAVNSVLNVIDSVLGSFESAASKFRSNQQSVNQAAKKAVDDARQFVTNVGSPFARGAGIGAAGTTGTGSAGAAAAGSAGGGGGAGVTGSSSAAAGAGGGGAGGGGGRTGGVGFAGGSPASGPGVNPPANNFAFNDWLDEILPERGTGSRSEFEQLNSALADATRRIQEFSARASSAQGALDDFTRSTDPGDTGRPRTAQEEDYIRELESRVQGFESETRSATNERRMAQMAVANYGTTADARAIAEESTRRGGASRAGLQYAEPGALTSQGLLGSTLRQIRDLRTGNESLNELFANVDTRPIYDVNNALAAVQQSLDAIRRLNDAGVIDETDFERAAQGARRLETSLRNQSAETTEYARDFETLGIQSEASIQATRRTRDEANRAIQRSSRLSDAEKARANNARDIQELSYLQEQIRGAQGASGFGGFRGREIGDEALNQTLQRTQLMNFRRNLEEARRNMQMAPDPAGGFLNQNSYATAIEAIDRQIANADRAFRVLNNSASDGERAFETMRNAFGVFSDDLGNLIPQLIAFDFAFNILYSTLLPLPRVVLQTTAEFDRLQTSIESFLLRTRNMTDASGVIDELKQQSLDLGIGFEQAAQSYLSLAAALQGTRLEGQEEDISRTLLTAGRGMGLGQDQLDRTTTALTQIVGKGTLQMEELRQQLAEQMPGALQITARAFGVTTRELYEMVSAGEIAGDEFVEKFIAQLKAEGADVNAVANSFASLQDQLGSAMQQMAAVAGQPLFTPLTLGLKLLVETVKTLIPFAGLLSVGILAVGANMAKTALGITSWRRASGQLFGAGMQLAQGNRTGAVAALTGQTLYGPALPPGQQRSGFSAGLGQTMKGLGQASSALKNAFGQMLVPMGGGPGRLALANLQSMKAASAGLGAGLKEAAKGAYAMGAGLTKALAPILKLYLAIEGISLLIKTVTGDLNKLDGTGKAADALSRGKGAENAPQLNQFQRFLSKINPASTIGRIQEDMTGGKVTQEVGKVYQSLLKDGQKYSAWRKTDAELQLKEDQLINQSKQNIGDDKRKRIDDEIKQIRDLRKEEAKKIAYSPSAISSSLNLIEQTRDNRESQIARLLRIEGVGEQDIGEFISGDKQLSEIPESNSLTPFARERVESYMKEIKALGELEEGITSTAKALELFDRVRSSLPTSLTAIDAEIQTIQEQIASEDLGTTEGRQAYNTGATRVRQLSMQREILALATEEQNVRLLEERAAAEQAAAAAAQTAGQVRLQALEAERSLLETINELQQKRREFSERKVENQISVSRAIGFSGDALKGERELIQLQRSNRQAELRDQRLLINSDRQRASIERDMKKAELRSTQAQLLASAANLNIDYVNQTSNAQAFRNIPTPENLRNAEIFQKLADETKRARDFTRQQATDYGKLITNADRIYEITQRTANERENILRIEARMVDQNALTQEQINYINQQRETIEQRQRAAEQQLAFEDRRADNLINALQERIGLTEKYLTLLQQEKNLVLQNRELDREIIDQQIQTVRDRESGGFFTRMSAYERTEDVDLLELGRERKRLMEEIATRQQNAALLSLQIDKQRLKIEQEIFKLEQQKSRIALATQRMQLISQIAILELQLTESIKADQGSGKSVAPDKQQALERLRRIRGAEGIGASTGQQDPNGIATALDSIEGGLKQLDQEGRRLEESSTEVAKSFRLQSESADRLIENQAQLVAKQKELADYEVIRWWNEFIDSLGGLGTVLSEATAGISEFRRSVAEGIAKGLREGGTSEAISSAAGRLSDQVLSSIIDEFMLKPMEQNLFRGIKALLGPGFGPAAKPEEVIKTTGEELKAQLDKGMEVDEGIKKEIESFHSTFKQNIDKLFDKSWQPPAGPEYVAPLMASSGGSGAFDTGLRTGPAGQIGAGDDYHQDIMFGRHLSIAEKVGLMDQLAKGYEEMGRVIEFSNNAVANERYRSTMTFEQKADLINRAEAAHANRPRGSGRPALDYYAPLASENRHGNSVVGQAMLAPMVPGARLQYGSDSGNGANVQAFDPQGRLIFEQLHGDRRLPLPSNRTLPVAAPPPLALPPALGPLVNSAPIPGQASSKVDAPGLETFPLTPGAAQTGVISLQTLPFQQVQNQLNGLGNQSERTTQGLAALGQAVAEATQPASGSTLGAGAAMGLPSATAPWEVSAPGLGDVANAQAEVADAAKGAAEDIRKAGSSAKPIPGAFTGLGTAMGAAVTALGSVALGIAGVQQMQKGGTYNTLMGLAGIFGAVGGVAGMFTPGGSLFGMFRANGGPVNARQPYIVGERGPELFLPESGGKVLSKNDTDSLFSKTRAQLEASRKTAQQTDQLSFARFENQPIDVRYESRVINGVEYVTTEQLRVATREAAERGKALAFQSMQSSVKTRKRLGL
jgi:tape measure domain-containing protein